MKIELDEQLTKQLESASTYAYNSATENKTEAAKRAMSACFKNQTMLDEDVYIKQALKKIKICSENESQFVSSEEEEKLMEDFLKTSRELNYND